MPCHKDSISSTSTDPCTGGKAALTIEVISDGHGALECMGWVCDCGHATCEGTKPLNAKVHHDAAGVISPNLAHNAEDHAHDVINACTCETLSGHIPCNSPG